LTIDHPHHNFNGLPMSRKYTIEFDLLDGHAPNTSGDIDAGSFSPTGWRSIGEPTGAAITNGAGQPLTAIYLKANKPGDTFSITAQSAGRLFHKIWVKNDFTEVYFMGAALLLDGQIVWMRVPRNEQADIDACNQCQFNPPPADPNCAGHCPFTGQVFTADPPDPPATNWTRIDVP
jgi:hypothetical protein